MNKVGQKKQANWSWTIRQKQVQQWDESKWKNETKQVNQDQPRDEWSWRHRKFRDTGSRILLRSTQGCTARDCQMSTETLWTVNWAVHREVNWVSPTNNPEAHQDAVYREMHQIVDRNVCRHFMQQCWPSQPRVDWSHLSGTCLDSWPYGPRSGHPNTTTLSSSIYQSLPLTNDYRLQEIW